MTMTDPTSDLLTRIRNGLAVNKRWVDVPSSNMKKRIVYIPVSYTHLTLPTKA